MHPPTKTSHCNSFLFSSRFSLSIPFLLFWLQHKHRHYSSGLWWKSSVETIAADSDTTAVGWEMQTACEAKVRWLIPTWVWRKSKKEKPLGMCYCLRVTFKSLFTKLILTGKWTLFAVFDSGKKPLRGSNLRNVRKWNDGSVCCDPGAEFGLEVCPVWNIALPGA